MAKKQVQFHLSCGNKIYLHFKFLLKIFMLLEFLYKVRGEDIEPNFIESCIEMGLFWPCNERYVAVNCRSNLVLY